MAKRRHITAEAPAAANGILDRRLLLRCGAGLAALWAAPVWAVRPDSDGSRAASSGVAESELGGVEAPARSASMGRPGRPFSNYGKPSAFERRTIRWIAADDAAPGNGVSWCPLHDLEGTTVPNGLHFERHHNGVPVIDPTAHRLFVHGLVRRSLAFDVESLMRYPMASHRCFIECGGNSNTGWHREPAQGPVGYLHGLVSACEWSGVPLSILLDEAGVEQGADWVVAEGADGFAHAMSIPVAKLRDDAILALYQNGERLRPENGYPMRLVLPGWEGVLNVKWLRRLHVANRPAMTRNETAKYTELMPDGRARMFTFQMPPKSVITRPASGMRLPGSGFYEIKGLAWSGHGRIRRVEVSADGGRTWAEAALDEPVLPRNLTRFRIPWRWQGQAAMLKSRAIDELGNAQPERDSLLRERGRHGYYHYNGIVAFAVSEDGYLTHAFA